MYGEVQIARFRCHCRRVAGACRPRASFAYVAQQSASAPVLAPDASMRTFALPPGYRVELVASEPLVIDPIFIDWDADGRMWVIEMPAYMIDIRGTGEQTPNGRIVVLEDMNDDGRMDKRTVFADGLVLPRALKVLRHGRARRRAAESLADARHERRPHGRHAHARDRHVRPARRQRRAQRQRPDVGARQLDVHVRSGHVPARLKTDKFEVRKTLSRGQWGVSQDDAGRIYRNTNSSVLHVDIVPTQYYTRTAGLVRTRGSYEIAREP